jgi:hypothetical protein
MEVHDEVNHLRAQLEAVWVAMAKLEGEVVAAREQLVAIQDKVAGLHGANTILAKQVMEAECDYDAAAADSSTTVARAIQYRDLHVALLEVSGNVLDVLSPVGVSVEECLDNVPGWFSEVIRHAVRRGAALALAAAFL